MIEYNKVFIDTAPFIYFIEKDINNPLYYSKMKVFSVMGTTRIRNLSPR